MFNRVYISVVISSIYPLFGYAAFFTYKELTRTAVTLNEIPEFSIFAVYPVGVAWALPVVVATAIYMGSRVKFFFFDEGDIEWIGEFDQMGRTEGKSKILARRVKQPKSSLGNDTEHPSVIEDDYDSLFASISEGSLSEE